MDIWIIQDGLDISSKTSNFQDIPDHVCCLSAVAIAVADAHRHTDTTDFMANQPSLAELELGLSCRHGICQNPGNQDSAIFFGIAQIFW